MQSKWIKLKDRAIKLRLGGNSITHINATLGISKGTLSGWFKDLVLPEKAKARIKKNWNLRLIKSRKYAVSWHRSEKVKRINVAQSLAKETLLHIPNSLEVVELALALLYIGEGGKGPSGTIIGNSDPLILRFFITILLKIYKVPLSQIRADLHLRADQNPVELKRYWSKALNLPSSNFKGFIFDPRTIGRPTYSSYKGVCRISCGNIHIQRKLIFIARLYAESLIEKIEGT